MPEKTQTPPSLLEEEKQLQHTSESDLSEDTPGVGAVPRTQRGTREYTLPVWMNWKIFATAFGILIFAGTLFASYKLGQIQEKRQEAQDTTEQLESIQCRRDEDCVLAIRLDQCCSCPTAVSREAVQKDKNLVEYEFGKDYSKEMKVDCRGGVVCEACVIWDGVICEFSKCKAVPRKAELEETYMNRDYGFEIKYLLGFEFSESKLMEDFIVDFTQIGHRPGISIRVINSVGPKWADLRDYFEKEFLNKGVGSSTQGEKGRTTVLEKTKIDGADAVKQIEESIPGAPTESYYSLCFYIYKNNRVYKLCNYAASKNLVLEKEYVFNLMIPTFRFINEKSFSEKVFCKDPRPEVCTMECISSPPYICGPDRKTYCSTCQACSDPRTEWYVVQDAPCGLGEAATKEECEAKGGVWSKWGLLGAEYCQIPSLDGGEPCLDGLECSLGKCISVSGKLPGECQKFKNTFGCFSFVEDGEAGQIICVD